jgi:hypothetical protein
MRSLSHCLGLNVSLKGNKLKQVILRGTPCGGEFEYLLRSPANRRRRQQGNLVPGV